MIVCTIGALFLVPIVLGLLVVFALVVGPLLFAILLGGVLEVHGDRSGRRRRRQRVRPTHAARLVLLPGGPDGGA